MPYKRYPSVQEMVGIFQGMRSRALAEEVSKSKIEMEKRDLARQTTRDRALSRNMRLKLRQDRKEHNETIAHNMAMEGISASNAQRMQEQLELDQKKNEQSSMMNLWNLHTNMRDLAYEQLNPGESEDEESYKKRYAREWALLSSGGADPATITRMLSATSPLSKPEDELSQSEKLNLELAWARHGLDVKSEGELDTARHDDRLLDWAKHGLSVGDSERLESHRNRTLLAGQRQDTIAMERDRRNDMRSLVSFIADRRSEKFDRMKPGSSEDDKEFAKEYGGLRQFLSSQKYDPQTVTGALSMIGPLEKPKDELTDVDKMRLVMPHWTTIAKAAPGAATDIMRSLGQDIDASALAEEPDMSETQKTLVNLLTRGQIGAADFIKGFTADDPTALAGIDIRPPTRNITSSDVLARRESAQMLGMDPFEATARAEADRLTQQTGKAHIAVKPTRKWRTDKWTVVTMEEAEDLVKEGKIEESEVKTNKTSGGFRY